MDLPADQVAAQVIVVQQDLETLAGIRQSRVMLVVLLPTLLLILAVRVVELAQ
jgi:hypothetical protein